MRFSRCIPGNGDLRLRITPLRDLFYPNCIWNLFIESLPVPSWMYLRVYPKVYPRIWRFMAAYNPSFAWSCLSEMHLKSCQWKLAAVGCMSGSTLTGFIPGYGDLWLHQHHPSRHPTNGARWWWGWWRWWCWRCLCWWWWMMKMVIMHWKVAMELFRLLLVNWGKVWIKKYFLFKPSIDTVHRHCLLDSVYGQI